MQDSDEAKVRHTLSDHALGQDLEHVHDGDADHDHDTFDDGPLDENPIWIQDHVSLTTVGIDIGSSGTQIIFSRINLRRLGEDLSSRFFVVSRETLFQSPVSLTPYQSEERIDELRLGTILDEAYGAARVLPSDIDTGVVILTGEALRRENAQAIASVIADTGGDFVCATAGHHMESMLAAYGSGAARVSSDQGKRILNIDIGGGTTKFAVVDKGRVVSTAAMHIGGRLQVVDENNVITRLDPAGKHHAERAGYCWQRGDVSDPCAMDLVADGMGRCVLAALTNPLPPAIAQLYLTEPITDLGSIDGVMFSGGVAEYIYQREDRDFGDMGRRLGQSLRRLIEAGALAWPVLPAGECIRATALGASEYSVQLSGNTSYISHPGALLPRRNLQVLQPPYVCAATIDPDAVAKAIRDHRAAFDLANSEREIALAFHWQGPPSHERLFAFAQGIRRGLEDRIAQCQPLFIMLDGDVAQTLGAILREELNVESDILVIDGVVLWDFDYIDLGRIRMPSNTVPVTIKSLVFSADPRVPGRHRLHHTHHHNYYEHRQHHDHSRTDAVQCSGHDVRE
jgi:ethanolamine utilization protein EutA